MPSYFPPNQQDTLQAAAPPVRPWTWQEDWNGMLTIGSEDCRSRSTLRSALVQVKQPSEDKKKKGVVYKVPCQDCDCVYIGKTSRTLEKRLSEHKNA